MENINKGCILIVDDERAKCITLKTQLTKDGYEVKTANNAFEALSLLEGESFHVVVTDLRMPYMDGIEFLKEIKTIHPATSVIVMTAYGSIETAVEAMKEGAFDYITKPFQYEELALRISRIRKYQQQVEEINKLRQLISISEIYPEVVGHSPTIRKVIEKVESIANSDTTIILIGESGTGKDLIARVIHERSPRKDRPFIKVSCGQLSREVLDSELFGHEAGAFTGAIRQRRGRFELANSGTIYLDDVDDIPIEIQIKLLGVIEERKFERLGGEKTLTTDARFIASTKKDLKLLMENGRFREDLYYRLNVIPIFLPTLRERKEDIPILVDHILQRISRRRERERIEITPDALNFLMCYSWPGNIRELENVLEQTVAFLQSPLITIHNLPNYLDMYYTEDKVVWLNLLGKESLDWSLIQKDVEEKLIFWALRKAKGNQTLAAKLLNMPKSSFHEKVKNLTIKPESSEFPLSE